MLLLCDEAVSKGCTRADIIMARELKVDARIYLKCTQNACGQFNANFMCPPYITKDISWQKVFSEYDFALLCQQTVIAERNDYRQIFDKAKPNFNAVMLALEQRAIREGFMLALSFYAGHCEVCESCALSDGESVCRMPNLARPSMEAVGLSVMDVNRQAGFPDGFVQGEVTLTGLVLLD